MIVKDLGGHAASITRSDPYRHKYGTAIDEYVDLTYDYGYDATGDTDGPYNYAWQIGKRIFYCDSQGFHDHDTYPSVSAAEEVFEAYQDAYNAWCATEEEGESEEAWTEADERLTAIVAKHTR